MVEMLAYILSTAATDGLVLMHQAISIHCADYIYICVYIYILCNGPVSYKNINKNIYGQQHLEIEPHFYPSGRGWRGIVVLVRAGSCQTLHNAYLWNCRKDFLPSKFYRIVWTWSCATSWSFAHLPHMGLSMGQKLQVPLGARFCGTHISETTGWIYTIWNSIELSKPAAAQHHRLMTLTLDFQGQMLTKLYHRNRRADWHGTKGMSFDR